MILIVKLGGQSLSLVAPLGAAAYAVHEQTDKASIIFAMMKMGEHGIDTYNRVLDGNTALQWQPVAARPEEQKTSAPSKDEYIAYEFIRGENGTWTPASDALTEFLTAMQAMQALPTAPPSSLATSLTGFGHRARAKKVATTG